MRSDCPFQQKDKYAEGQVFRDETAAMARAIYQEYDSFGYVVNPLWPIGWGNECCYMSLPPDGRNHTLRKDVVHRPVCWVVPRTAGQYLL